MAVDLAGGSGWGSCRSVACLFPSATGLIASLAAALWTVESGLVILETEPSRVLVEVLLVTAAPWAWQTALDYGGCLLLAQRCLHLMLPELLLISRGVAAYLYLLMVTMKLLVETMLDLLETCSDPSLATVTEPAPA